MKFVLLYHSLVSCWNHGNAHFLRGIARELLARGHQVTVLEPRGGWSRSRLVADHGADAEADFARAFPDLRSTRYDPAALDLDRALDGADVVIVHEWTDPELVRRIGRHRAAGGGYALLFHDTHHRALTDPDGFGGAGLDAYDGVLAYGEVLREIYLRRGWARRAWTWHEAADTVLFRPRMQDAARPRDGDLVWIGNWGDDERTAELDEYLLRPVARLGLSASVHGVRYPPDAIRAVQAAGARYGGWLPNHRVPEVFSRYRVTVHVPRRPYVRALPGIPTIRVFEALACGIPLVSAPWQDAEGLFRAGRDLLFARDGAQMGRHLRDLANDPAMAAEIASSGLQTIHDRHTCRHRVDQLLAVCAELRGDATEACDAELDRGVA